MDREFASRLVAIALDKGAAEAEAYVKTSRSLAVEVRERKVDTLETSSTAGYCVRIIRDGRLGFSYSTDPAEIEAVAERALESSRYTEPDEYAGLPSQAGNPEVPAAAGIYDNAVASLPEDAAIHNALAIEKSAYDADSRIKRIRKASANFGVNTTHILNSKGIDTRYSSTGCSASITVIAEQGAESQMGWDYEGSRFLRDISFEQVGRNAAQRALQLLGARKTSPVKGFVLLDSSVTTEFLGILSSAFSSESVQKKKSMLAGKRGELVLSRKLDVIDTGLLEGRLGSKPVDDEGVPTTHKRLIEKGVLNGFLYNTYTGRKEGVHSTGNAVRGGFGGIPTVGPTNLLLRPSSDEYAAGIGALTGAVDRGLYVVETMGMHTANPISGEFSVGVSGLWIEKGEITYPVKEAVISGTILGLFGNTAMVGDDLRFYGNIGAPSVLIEGIDISG